MLKEQHKEELKTTVWVFIFLENVNNKTMARLTGQLLEFYCR